jgi:hypothetical protein
MTTETHILVKANATDPHAQRVLVREGEYYHPQLFRWVALPAAWQEQAREALAKAAADAGR